MHKAELKSALCKLKGWNSLHHAISLYSGSYLLPAAYASGFLFRAAACTICAIRFCRVSGRLALATYAVAVSCLRRRVAKIYLPSNRDLFLCRYCYCMNYYYGCNESGDVHFAAMRRTKRAARKLVVADPEDVYMMRRPKGMHKETFQRLRRNVIDAIEREQRAYASGMRRFAR